MDINELRINLRNKNVPESCYSLNGLDYITGGDSYVLEFCSDFWYVFYFERGEKYDLRRFIHENEACREIYERILSDHSWQH